VLPPLDAASLSPLQPARSGSQGLLGLARGAWTERHGRPPCSACVQIAGGESIAPRDRRRESSAAASAPRAGTTPCRLTSRQSGERTHLYINQNRMFAVATVVHTRANLPVASPAVPLLWQVTDCLDVVAIRVADKCPVVGGVVFRPQPRFVQDLGVMRHSVVEEGAHSGPAWRGEGYMGFPESFAGDLAADPEVRRGGHPVADRLAEVHDTLASQRGKHSVVEGGAGGQVRTLDRKMIKHGAYPATITGKPSGPQHAPATGTRSLCPDRPTPSGR